MPDVHLAVVTESDDCATDDLRRLAGILDARIEGDVRFGTHDRMLYATDASIYQVPPIGVVLPRTRGDLLKTIRFAHDEGIAILPRGGGTSLVGQAVNRALVVDTSKYLTSVLEVSVEQGTCRVESGVVLDDLNRTLAPHGLMFAPDVATSSHATIGGMIGNNSAGAHSVLYGRTVEHIVGIECALADGSELSLHKGAGPSQERVHQLQDSIAEIIKPIAREIRDRYPHTKRNSGGYLLDVVLDQIEQSTPGTLDCVNLSHLLCGSEGTLATTVAATLSLVPRPEHRALGVIAYSSLEAALDQLPQLLESGPAAVELLDDVVVSMARRNSICRGYLDVLPAPAQQTPGAYLYVEFFGDSPSLLDARRAALEAIVPAGAFVWYTSETDMAAAWMLRKSGEPLLHAVPGARKPLTFIEDTAVDPGRLAAFVAEFKAIVQRHGTRAAYYAHASVGCLHIRPLIDLHDQNDRERMQAISLEVTELVRRYQGAVSGEHGDGRARSHLLERFYGPVIVDAFHRIKTLFDPDNRMNPGNLVEPVSMVDNLRVQPEDKPAVISDTKTFFRYEHGFAEAIEQCNGAGVCRRTRGGTMCPSYRATRDERHATRGRGNALRLAISGQLSGGWDDPETLRTLELCLSCKACKAECPSNVDMAKLKSEYLAQGYRRRGRIPMASRLIGNVRNLNRIASLLPGVANAMGGSRLVRKLLNPILDVHPRRTLPRVQRSLYRWMARRPLVNPKGPVVVLLADCFTVYNEPHVGRAAVRVLEKYGYRVILPRVGCCGRSMISVGMLGQAARTIQHTASSLIDVLDREEAVAIVGCEPSCISAIRDDWLELQTGLDAAELERIAGMTFLVEEFLERSWDSHPREVDAGRPSNHIVVHGHCHQKALWGAATSTDLLTRFAGPDAVSTLDSGCCGMAGSFGYGRERYDLSMVIGEQSLFGLLCDHPDSTIAAPGISCRQQILDGTGRQARHPIELVDEWMRAASCQV